MPDTLMVGPVDRPAQAASLAERFLTPPGFGWGRFATADGAGLRYGCLAAVSARADCVLVGGFGEFIEMHFETARDLAACGLSVWCLEWRGQGRSARPGRWPSRPRPRNFDRDADELAEFAAAAPDRNRPRVLIAHSMGGAIALLCLHRHPGLFDAAVTVGPDVRPAHRSGAAAACCAALRRRCGSAGSRAGFIPGLPHWRMDRVPSPATSRASSDPERCRLRHAWMAAEPELRLGCPDLWLARRGARAGRADRPAGVSRRHRNADPAGYCRP